MPADMRTSGGRTCVHARCDCWQHRPLWCEPRRLVPHQATFAFLMMAARLMTLRRRGSVTCRFRQAM